MPATRSPLRLLLVIACGMAAGVPFPVLAQGSPAVAAGAQVQATPQAPAAAEPGERPRIGLALGGGAARGIAHIGFIRWLEEHRVPIDFIAGTSMGGLIGGAYASGLTPDEMQALMKNTEWDLVFLADSPFKFKNFRRKEDARAYPAQIDFGLKGGFKLPSGLNAGEQIELMLDGIALPYHDIASFDDLPTPFRAVAADLRSSDLVVLGSGSLAKAMRATMAIPLYFTPVELDGHLLVDGGTLNNVPADVARRMGAGIVIAVNVGSNTDPPKPPGNLFGVLGQTLDTMMSTGVRDALKHADLVVAPDLRGLTGMDWRRSDELVKRGYDGAEAQRDKLLPYAVDEATYAEWRRQREARRRSGTPTVQFVRVEGVSESEQKRIGGAFEREHLGKPLDRARVERDVLRLTGTDRYELVGYRLSAEPEGVGLVVTVTPKAYGPPFLLPALDLQNIDSNTFTLDLRARLAVYDTLVRGSETRLDFGIGSRQFVAGEFYRRIAGTGFFVAPRGYFERKGINAFSPDREFVAEYREKRTGGGIDIGYTTGLRNEVRFGYDVADIRTRLRVGAPSLPEATGDERVVSLRWTFDDQSSPVIPTRGVYSRAELRYFGSTPDLKFPDGTDAVIKDLPQAEIRLSWFHRWRERHRFVVTGNAGTSFGEDAGYEQFRLGGLVRLSAFSRDELRGDNYVVGGGGLLYQIGRLPDLLGGNLFVASWLEAGSAFNRWDDADFYAPLTVGAVAETIFGPFFIGGSVSLNTGDGRFYVALAPLVGR